MKKIPTLFTRIYENHRVVGIKDEITPGCEDAFKNGIATIKVDGSCYDPDPVTGHWPHWVEVTDNSSDHWFMAALNNSIKMGMDPDIESGTYEAIGPHFNGNPYNLSEDKLVKHGMELVYVKRDFKSISNWLNENPVEGLVFWLDGEPVCKIKRSDFGYEWPVKGVRR